MQVHKGRNISTEGISDYWYTATVNAWYNGVKQHRPWLGLGWVTVLVCQFLLIVLWMRLYTKVPWRCSCGNNIMSMNFPLGSIFISFSIPGAKKIGLPRYLFQHAGNLSFSNKPTLQSEVHVQKRIFHLCHTSVAQILAPLISISILSPLISNVSEITTSTFYHIKFTCQ